jgi:hypothetical protein
MTEVEVQQHLEQLKKDKIFLGWRPGRQKGAGRYMDT